MNLEAACEYHGRRKPAALLISHGGSPVLEQYAPGFDARKPHALYSGTKSFWGVAALVAQSDGLLELDERVWNGATFRQLLDLTAGAPFGGLGSAVPVYEKALTATPNDLPGRRFTYGGIPLQIFGAIFAERLREKSMTPHEYLRERILAPAGVSVASWRTLKDGTHPLPTGASLTAGDWSAYGNFVLNNRERFNECFRGSDANPRYGLAWWLATKHATPQTFYASGSGGQALYVIPERNIVMARFGEGAAFDHDAFLRRCELL